MKRVILRIDGMTCSACSSGLEKYLKKQKGIMSVDVNLVMAIATIQYENISRKEIESYIKRAGFASLGEFKSIDTKETSKIDKIKLILLGVFLVIFMFVSMGHMFLALDISFINHSRSITFATMQLGSAIIFLCYGFDILKSGFKNLIHKMPNMDTLIMFSVLISFVYSLYGYFRIITGKEFNLYFESLCMIIYFVKLGRYIENISKDKTKEALKKLVQITPKEAILIVDGKEKIVSIDEVKKDDVLVCRAGDKVAVDGEVMEGKIYVDESFITGESMPVLKGFSSKLKAGSICYDGYVLYKATKIGRESTISEIIKLVVEATNVKSRVQKLADKISGYFVPIIIFIAVLTFLSQWIIGVPLNVALKHMITILVVACPCALGLAVPIVVVVCNGVCAKKGLFLRSGVVLENARNIDTVVCDKTGTLTLGKLKVFRVFNYGKYAEEELLNLVANLEGCSTHPIKTAFKIIKELKVNNFKNFEGKGVYGEVNNKKYYLGNDNILKDLKINNPFKEDEECLTLNACSIIYVVENKKIIGLIGVRDIVRSNMKEVIQKFKKENIDIIMLTGDNEKAACLVAEELDIANVRANVLPQAKAEYIKDLTSTGKMVIMVGDGINDAPAIVNATIGVSINEGMDIAMNAADVILMNNDLANILDLIMISKKAYSIIKENLFWAFFYNALMIPVAMGLFSNFGIVISPMFGSVAMIFSSLTVIFNSLRLGEIKWK